MSKSMSFFEGQLASPRRRAAFGLAGAIATGALALGLTFAGPATSVALADDTGTDTTATETDDVSLAERVAAEVLPSVGSVNALIDNGYERGIAQGSCVVISTDGYILTNYHVIEGASQVQVVLGDVAYDAEIVGSDPTSDVAVLKVEVDSENPLTPIKIGDSSEVAVGQWVMTVGSPYGESESVSVGIVSGLSRTAAVQLESTEAYYPGLIQSDAMINSGSSGGAMVNADGELIGMTTLSGTQSGDWAGMTYAIPSNYAIDIAQQIIETGTVEHPQLGVSVTSVLDAYYQGAYGMGDMSVTGAYVAAVVEGSGADEAGIQVGDIITALNGDEIAYSDDLIIAVRSNEIGDTVTLTVNRDGEEFDVDVVLGSDADEGTSEAVEEDTSPFGFLGWGNESADDGTDDQGGTDAGIADENASDEGDAGQSDADQGDTGQGDSFGWGWTWDDGSGSADGGNGGWGWGIEAPGGGNGGSGIGWGWGGWGI